MPSTATSDQAKILRKIDEWKTELLDISNKNPLLNCVIDPPPDRKTGSRIVEIVHPNGQSIWDSLVIEAENSLTFAWKNRILGIDEADGEDVLFTDEEKKKKSASTQDEIEACLQSGKLKGNDIWERFPISGVFSIALIL